MACCATGATSSAAELSTASTISMSDFEAGFGLVAILSEGEAARCRSLLRPGELRVQTDATPAIWAAGCHFSTQLARPHAAGGGKQVLRPPPLKIASTAEHVHRVPTRAQGKGTVAGRRTQRTRTRPARRAALPHAPGDEVGGSAAPPSEARVSCGALSAERLALIQGRGQSPSLSSSL